jgi:hypothetical protein
MAESIRAWLFGACRSSLCPCADIFSVSWDDTFKPRLFLLCVEGISWRCFRPAFPMFSWVIWEGLSLAFFEGFWSLCTGTWADLLFDALKLIGCFCTYLWDATCKQNCLFTSVNCIGTRSLSIWPVPCSWLYMSLHVSHVETASWILGEPSSGYGGVLFIRKALSWIEFLNASLVMSVRTKLWPLFCTGQKVSSVPLMGDNLGPMDPISDMLIVGWWFSTLPRKHPFWFLESNFGLFGCYGKNRPVNYTLVFAQYKISRKSSK